MTNLGVSEAKAIRKWAAGRGIEVNLMNTDDYLIITFPDTKYLEMKIWLGHKVISIRENYNGMGGDYRYTSLKELIKIVNHGYDNPEIEYEFDESTQVNEGLLSNMGYKLFKRAVCSKLQKAGFDLEQYADQIEEWCQDWYQDGFDARDCALALCNNLERHCEGVINNSQPLKEEVNNMNSEEELKIAKRTAERAGYKVEFPAPAAPQGGRGLIADNAAKIAAARARLGLGAAQAPVPPQMTAADDLERLALAARTAEKAGYTVRRAEAQPAPAPEKKEYAPWLKGAVNFMNREQ